VAFSVTVALVGVTLNVVDVGDVIVS